MRLLCRCHKGNLHVEEIKSARFSENILKLVDSDVYDELESTLSRIPRIAGLHIETIADNDIFMVLLDEMRAEQIITEAYTNGLMNLSNCGTCFIDPSVKECMKLMGMIGYKIERQTAMEALSNMFK